MLTLKILSRGNWPIRRLAPLQWSSLEPVHLSGWSKTSHPLEAPEDNDGWSSAEEPINSSDAEEEGGVGPRKLVILAPTGRSAWCCLLVPGKGALRAPARWSAAPVAPKGNFRCQGSLCLCPPVGTQRRHRGAQALWGSKQGEARLVGKRQALEAGQALKGVWILFSG